LGDDGNSAASNQSIVELGAFTLDNTGPNGAPGTALSGKYALYINGLRQETTPTEFAQINTNLLELSDDADWAIFQGNNSSGFSGFTPTGGSNGSALPDTHVYLVVRDVDKSNTDLYSVEYVTVQ